MQDILDISNPRSENIVVSSVLPPQKLNKGASIQLSPIKTKNDQSSLLNLEEFLSNDNKGDLISPKFHLAELSPIK
jgi:hypothetical protein